MSQPRLCGLLLLAATLSVSAAYGQSSSATPEAFRAFSLRVAERMVKAGSITTDMRQLAGINVITGLVDDRRTADVILVGHHDPLRGPLTLDDFAVAVRSRFIFHEWPLVSIDPVNRGRSGDAEFQRVRFEGGISGSAFAETLFLVDHLLKRIGLGLLDPRVPEFPTLWKLTAALTSDFDARFWFSPTMATITLRDGVLKLPDMNVGLSTETTLKDGASPADPAVTAAASTFVNAFLKHFDDIAINYPPFARLRGLNEMVALTKGLEEMRPRPELRYWLFDYPIDVVTVPTQVPTLRRLISTDETGDDGLPTSSWLNALKLEVGTTPVTYRRHSISGGIRLTALALRVRAGDVMALREAVLATRPDLETLTWSFVAGAWIVSLPEGDTDRELATLAGRVTLLLEKRNQNASEITALLNQILAKQPEWDWPYIIAGTMQLSNGRVNEAATTFSLAIDLVPESPILLQWRAVCSIRQGAFEAALRDLDHALRADPNLGVSRLMRGLVRAELHTDGSTLEDLNGAVRLLPNTSSAFIGRAIVYATTGRYAEALADFRHSQDVDGSVRLYVEAHLGADSKEVFTSYAFLQMLEAGFDGLARRLLAEGANVNAIDGVGKTPLMLAASRADLRFVQMIAAAGGNVNATDADGDPAIVYATRARQSNVVMALLKLGASPTGRALLSASANGDTANVDALLAAGATPDQILGDDGATPLVAAAQEGHIDVVRQLLNAAANPNFAGDRGPTALHQAAQNGHLEIVKLLLDHHAAVDQVRPGLAPALYTAAASGHEAIVSVLLAHGADPNSRNPNGVTALAAAAQKGQVGVIRSLFVAGAKPSGVLEIPGAPKGSLWTAMVFAVTADQAASVRALVDGGASMEQGVDSVGRTALLVAVLGNHLEAMKALLALGARVNVQGATGQTPLTAALSLGAAPAVELLINHGANISARDISIARETRRDDLVRLVETALMSRR